MTIDVDILTTSKLHKRLMNKAVHYLGRYQASRQRLRRVLAQFARRKLQPQQADEPARYQPDEITKAIEDIILICVDYGYVDDNALAHAKARASVRTGHSAYQLSGKLREMGIDKDITSSALDARAQEYQNPEMAAALTAMRKKRLGPYHKDYDSLPFEETQKQFAKLARLGFSSDLIKRLLALPTIEDAEILLYEAQAKPDFET